MSTTTPELKSEVRQTLEKLGKVLSGKGGESRCVLVRCSDIDVVNSMLTVVPQAYQRIMWQSVSMADVHVATELRNAVISAQAGSRVIPLFHSWPGELTDRCILPEAAAGIDEIELESGLQAFPMVFIVLAPSIRVFANHAKQFWKNKGAYLAWPNLKQAATAVAAKAREDGNSAEVSEVLARLQGEKAGAFLVKSAEKEMARNHRDKAREFLMGAVQVYSQVANLSGMARVYHLLGVNCMAEGDLIAATEWFGQAVDNWQIVGDDDGLSETYAQKGQVHFIRGELDRAGEAFRKALKIDEAKGDKARIASGKRHIAMVLERVGSWKKAEEVYRQSLALEQELSSQMGEARVLHHLGRLFDQQKSFQKAEDFYRQSIAIKESIGDNPGVATTWHEFGNMRLAQGESADAIELYGKAIDIEKQIRDYNGLVKTMAQKGLAEIKSNRFEDALRSLAMAHHLARRLRSNLAPEIVQKIREMEDMLSIDTYNRILREVTESLPNQ